MHIYEWNIPKIVIDTLKNEFRISYAQIARSIGCTEQTLLDWRKGVRKPQKSSIWDMCERFPGILSEDEQKRYLLLLKTEFVDAGSQVNASLEECNSVKELLEYLFEFFEKELNEDKVYGIINGSYSKSLLKEIILKKLKMIAKNNPIFRAKELGDEEKRTLCNKGMCWKLNLDHCIILKFKEYKKQYTYKVLVDFDFTKREYELAGGYIESRDATKVYDVEMILLFENFRIPEEEMRFFMDSNIYIERVDTNEIENKKYIKDYICSDLDVDTDMEMIANKYADIVVERLKKYFFVIYKNILFDSRKNLTNVKKDNYIFWEAKFATRHHINFEQNRILELLDKGDIPSGGKALAIGYLSFPCMLRLADKYEKIYLMDNSNTSVKMYEQYIKQYVPQLVNKLEFIIFTSVMFESIMERYQLYRSIDFILIGTGSGSFIQSPQSYYLMCNSWLKKGGALFMSFLNSEFLYEYVDPATAEQNFEFIPVINEKRGTAFIGNNTEKYELYCEAYHCNDIRDIAEKYFEVVKMYSYPLASVLEGTHKSRLQNILKELDKEYSRQGIDVKTFSNSRGYYIDAVFRKKSQEIMCVSGLGECDLEETLFSDKEMYEEHYLKTLLLTEKTFSVKEAVKNNLLCEIHVMLLPSKKMLPETINSEITIKNKKYRFLNIAEINLLGIEYRNISPFLISYNEQIKFISNYDEDLEKSNKKFFYIGNGKNDRGYKVEKEKLLELLKEHSYRAIQM